MPPDVVRTCGGMSLCRVETSLPKPDFSFTGDMDTRGLDACLQQVFPIGWDA